MNRLSRLFLLSGSLGLFLLQTPLRGQEVPSPSQILGYELGEKFTPVAGVSHYFSALAEASDRVSVHPFGRSVEGRPLLQPVEDLSKISGVITEESLDRLGQSTWLAQVGVGRGSLILFVEDPLFRMFWYSGFQLYANALLMGPAF